MIIGPEMAAIAFGLASALSWGAGDFSGGLASRRDRLTSVIVISQGAGLLLLVLLVIIRGEPVPPVRDLLWAAAAGWVGAVGLTTFYRALAVGKMGLVAPIAAVLGVALPVVVGSLTDGLPDTLQIVGFGFALVSIWLVSYSSGLAGRTDGLRLALLAGMTFGVFFVLMKRATEDGLFWPLIVARTASVGLILAVTLVSRREWRPKRDSLGLVLVAGIFDSMGNTFYVLASQAGRLDVAVIVSSLYPAITVLLARFILKEHVTRLQAMGILAALLAILLIAL